MKERTLKEKAKRYDDAIKKAGERYDKEYTSTLERSTLSYVFPELRESDDERIRKEITTYLKSVIANKGYGDSIIESWIDWLEKQGEQILDTDFSDLRTWKYVVDAVLTEKEGIGQYLDSPFTEEVAKKLQKRFGNIEQKPTDKVEPKFLEGQWITIKE